MTFNMVFFQAHLALYCFANNQVPNALKLMYRARYLAILCHGEYHPEVALFDVSPDEASFPLYILRNGKYMIWICPLIVYFDLR